MKLSLKIIFLISLIGQTPFVSAKPDQAPEIEVVFYPTYGYLLNAEWHIPIKIWLHKKPHRLSRISGKGSRYFLRKKANIDELSEAQSKQYNQIAYDFLTDSKSRERVPFKFFNDPQNEIFELSLQEKTIKSDRNGNIEGVLVLSQIRAQEILNAQKSQTGWLTISTTSIHQKGEGKIRLIPPQGISVISDIDDTLKITNIPLGKPEVLRNTLFNPFQFSDNMRLAFKQLPEETAIHYLSGSPWQLFPPLNKAMIDDGMFPQGTFHMKNVRTNPFESESYQDISQLILHGSKKVTFKQKISQITQILSHFPSRQFILIGDSGEMDPEIYRQIKTDFSEQIIEIKIRDIVNDAECKPTRLKGMKIIPVVMVVGASCEIASPTTNN